jgi:hypothetical protein
MICYRTLAALGAAVTLLALALDPFFQQLVNFPERLIVSGEGAIPLVTQYQPRLGVLLKNLQKAAQVSSKGTYRSLNISDRTLRYQARRCDQKRGRIIFLYKWPPTNPIWQRNARRCTRLLPYEQLHVAAV